MKRFAAVTAFLAVFALQGISDTPQDEAEFVFARVEFNMRFGGLGSYNAEGQPAWLHDYPYSEDLFLTLLRETTGINTSREAYQIVELEDEEIFRYPFLYISEPGFMDLTDDEIENFREFFNRGGFAIFDDFRGRDLVNLRQMMKLVFPNREMELLSLSHPVFHTYYEIDTLKMDPPYIRDDAGTPEFWGMSDEDGRLILVANQNNDFGEFWEYIDRGDRPLQTGVQAFQFAVNYLIYAMTH